MDARQMGSYFLVFGTDMCIHPQMQFLFARPRRPQELKSRAACDGHLRIYPFINLHLRPPFLAPVRHPVMRRWSIYCSMERSLGGVHG